MKNYIYIREVYISSCVFYREENIEIPATPRSRASFLTFISRNQTRFSTDARIARSFFALLLLLLLCVCVCVELQRVNRIKKTGR